MTEQSKRHHKDTSSAHHSRYPILRTTTYISRLTDLTIASHHAQK